MQCWLPAQGGRSTSAGASWRDFSVSIHPACNTSGLTLPILDYTHDDGACSIIGGYVYRGTLNPAATGRYFYADFCAGFVRSFQLQNGQPRSQNSWPLLSPPGNQITSFGEDARGELYLMTLAGGLFHIVAN